MPEVVNDVRLNAAALQKYQEDATVMHVLNKLRRFQVPFFTPHSNHDLVL